MAKSQGSELERPTEPDEDRIRIGSRRLQAISKILSFATDESYTRLQQHLVLAGDYQFSCLSDESLGVDFIWPNSVMPQQDLPEEASPVACDAVEHEQSPTYVIANMSHSEASVVPGAADPIRNTSNL